MNTTISFVAVFSLVLVPRTAANNRHEKKTVSPHTVDFIVLLQNEGITGLENACPYVASISGGWSVFCVQDRLTCGFEARWVMRL